MNAEISETLAGKVHRQVIASMVAVRAGRSRGSGVFVGENEVVTNCHVIDTGEVIEIFPATPGPDSTSAAGRIVAALDCDLCLLKVDGLSGEPATIGDAEKLRLGDSVFAVGFPEYPSETLSSGIISRLSSEEDIFPKPEIQTTAPFHFGMSGGGLFNEAGELIGIPALSEGRGENKNLAVSARHVSQLRENADFEEFWHSTLPNALSAPNPHQLRSIAHGIAQPSNDPLRAAYNWQDIGCEEAKAQNYPGAKFALDHMLGKENSEDVEVRDAVAAAASEIYAHLGIFDKALRHAEKINDQFLRMEHLAIVAKERARTGDWKAARKILDRIFRRKGSLILFGESRNPSRSSHPPARSMKTTPPHHPIPNPPTPEQPPPPAAPATLPPTPARHQPPPSTPRRTSPETARCICQTPQEFARPTQAASRPQKPPRPPTRSPPKQTPDSPPNSPPSASSKSPARSARFPNPTTPPRRFPRRRKSPTCRRCP